MTRLTQRNQVFRNICFVRSIKFSKWLNMVYCQLHPVLRLGYGTRAASVHVSLPYLRSTLLPIPPIPRTVRSVFVMIMPFWIELVVFANSFRYLFTLFFGLNTSLVRRPLFCNSQTKRAFSGASDAIGSTLLIKKLDTAVLTCNFYLATLTGLGAVLGPRVINRYYEHPSTVLVRTNYFFTRKRFVSDIAFFGAVFDTTRFCLKSIAALRANLDHCPD